MNKNLVPKIVLILILVALAVIGLYPPDKKLKPGIDLAGGTSLIYAINTEGLTASEETDLAQRMIAVLRRRIDPANIQNLVWRPLGNTRFEIQMPLASKATQQFRQAYEAALNDLLARNTNPATIMRALQEPAAERTETLARFAQGDPNRAAIIDTLVSTYDARRQAQEKRDALYQKLDGLKKTLSDAGVAVDRVEANRGDWTRLAAGELANTLKDFAGSEEQVAPLTEYVTAYKELVEVLNQLTAEAGLNDRYDAARRKLDQLNLTIDQVTYILEMDQRSSDRVKRIEQLKAMFPDRAAALDNLVTAYDTYRPYRGQLDDPKDLQRMLKGAGILEWRILPTRGRTELSEAEIERYTQELSEKGPKSASDSQYVWCEIEDPTQFGARNAVFGQFGDKSYVLASNRPNEAILRATGGRGWKLEKSFPSSDNMGRRAIGFHLDDKGGALFYNVTRENPGRPLCILLDGIAISAPEINPDSPIGSQGIITGSFTMTQITDMVNKLNAGSLPARLIEQPISERVIGPSVGADNLQKGIRSGIIGLVVVACFMLAYYMVGGSIADVALLLNILFVLAIMAGLRATFTLPGIAGLILTIGMSVDANVLIFERIREEQAKGVGLTAAIRNGYARAFSAIFDSNLTTILTAAILYYVASEDIKGFAIVLMLGIASSMFTAIFVTRVILDLLVSKRIIKERLVMLRLISVPKINWMGMRKIFYVVSGLLVIGGLTLFFVRGQSKYDIEFTGGTSVQMDLKEGVSLTRADVEKRIQEIGVQLNNPGLQAATIYSVGEPIGESPSGEKIYSQYEITTTAINKLQTVVTFSASRPAVDAATAEIRKAESELGRRMGMFELAPDGAQSYVVSTSRVNPAMVQDVLTKAFPNATIAEPEVEEVVTDAIRQAFQGQLEIQQNLHPAIASAEKITEEVVDTYPELADYVGGIRLETTLQTPATLAEIRQRIQELRFRLDTQNLVWYPYAVYGSGLKNTDPNQPVSAFTFVSVEPEAGLRTLSEQEWERFVNNERNRVLLATQRETTLPRVTQIDPFVGSEAKTRSLISIVLSLAAIVGYIWLRFGSLRFGLAAIACLFHDVSIAVGAIAISTYLAQTAIGPALLVSDFRINGTLIAAILTLLGYSLNDTIVIFDRIRENRHKAQLTPQTITNSINETLSRTIITGVTTLFVVFVMYVFGGSGLRGFNYVILIGLIVGTYSSIAVAPPLLLIGTEKQQAK